jgi:hypothetical protein
MSYPSIPFSLAYLPDALLTDAVTLVDMVLGYA